MVLSKTAHQFKFRLAGRRDFDGLDALFARCGVEETQEGLVRLDAVVGRLVRDLEGELQGIARAQDDGIWAFLEGNPVRMSRVSMSGRYTGVVAYPSERSLPPSDPITVNLGD